MYKIVNCKRRSAIGSTVEIVDELTLNSIPSCIVHHPKSRREKEWWLVIEKNNLINK